MRFSNFEDLLVRTQDPRTALDDYLCALSGAGGTIPEIMLAQADLALAHLKRALHSQVRFRALVDRRVRDRN
ncbi:MAG: hypothetical protein AB7S38_13055 [Vulcanimicrobiota bacterium]